jgi:ATP-dependent DNA helicase RecG
MEEISPVINSKTDRSRKHNKTNRFLFEWKKSMKVWVGKAKELLAASLEPPKHELNEMDWKSALSSDSKRLTEHLCAFSNYPGGGFFIFGVATDGNLKGVTFAEIEQITNRLTNLGRDAIEPPVQLDHMGQHFLGSDLLFVHVPESTIKPVHRRGQPMDDTFIRSGGTTRKASRQEVGSMMIHSQTPKWEGLHASLLLSDDQLMSALSIEPILEMLGQPLPIPPEEKLRWMADSSYIERIPSGGGYVSNLGCVIN